ncbi:hypothetical protein JHK85_014817 [Glycine max]|uniref:Uncharacterized protein n=1 Tax=Glycine max TaxID=3847 RepID=K7KT86_SOYBN|nr:hypothetical protein JHK85_014817 [Glycine max]KAH1124291.1 hypothetical protein GYH30_014155 [Glycine max]
MDSFKLGARDIVVMGLFMLGHSCDGVHETHKLARGIMCLQLYHVRKSIRLA